MLGLTAAPEIETALPKVIAAASGSRAAPGIAVAAACGVGSPIALALRVARAEIAAHEAVAIERVHAELVHVDGQSEQQPDADADRRDHDDGFDAALGAEGEVAEIDRELAGRFRRPRIPAAQREQSLCA